MPDHDRAERRNCQSRCGSISTAARSAAALARRRVVLLVSLLFVCGLAIPRRVASRSPDPRILGRTEDHVHVAIQRVARSDTILITLRIDPGYHVNANPASEEYLIPTSVAFAGATPERIGYPPSIRLKPAFSDEPIAVYEGSVVIAATFPPGTLDRTPGLTVTVTAQACTDRICLPPADITLPVERPR
jgi:hypothetical protein